MIELTAQTWRQKWGHHVLAINRGYRGKIKKSNGSRKKSPWLTCFPVWFLAFRFLRLDGLDCTRTFGRSRLVSSFVTVTWGELLIPEKEIKTYTSSGSVDSINQLYCKLKSILVEHQYSKAKLPSSNFQVKNNNNYKEFVGKYLSILATILILSTTEAYIKFSEVSWIVVTTLYEHKKTEVTCMFFHNHWL